MTGSAKPGTGGAGAGVPPPPDPAALAEIEKYVAQLAKDPKSRAFAPLADAYRKVGLCDEAIDVCLEGLKHHSTWTGGRVALARAYLEKGSKKEAREELEKVVKVTPDNPLAQRLLGILCQEAGETDRAVAAFKAVLIFSPDDAEARERLATLDPSAVEPPRSAPAPRPAPAKPAVTAPAAAKPPAAQASATASLSVPARPEAGASPGSPTEETIDLLAAAEEPAALEGEPADAIESGVDLGEGGLGGAREIDFGAESAPAVTAESAEAPAAAAAAELMAELTGEGDEASEPVAADPDSEADPLSTEGIDFGGEAVSLDEPAVDDEPDADLAFAEADDEPPVAPAAGPTAHASAVEGPPLLPLGSERPPDKPKTEITTNTIAELYIKQGFYQKALDIYRSMLQADPDNADVALRLSQVEAEFAAKRKPAEAPAARHPAAQAGATSPSPARVEPRAPHSSSPARRAATAPPGAAPTGSKPAAATPVRPAAPVKPAAAAAPRPAPAPAAPRPAAPRPAAPAAAPKPPAPVAARPAAAPRPAAPAKPAATAAPRPAPAPKPVAPAPKPVAPAPKPVAPAPKPAAPAQVKPAPPAPRPAPAVRLPPQPAATKPPAPKPGEGATGPATARAGRNIQTLEAWLQNIKRR